MNKEKIIIIGAGPAGLTAAYEILKTTNYIPIILEESDQVGGISKTIDYKGNKLDIGGHRFFTKSKVVQEWWTNIFPIDKNGKGNKIFLIKKRISRILYLKKFFDYPLKINLSTLNKLGFVKTTKILLSYFKCKIFPIKNENNLKEFFTNRFGKELYLTFFKDYTEKLWGVKCEDISSEWGRQRIKGLDIKKALADAFLKQKNTETTLIKTFYYPKLGPGQFWEEVALRVVKMGGKILLNHKCTNINFNQNEIYSVDCDSNKKLYSFKGKHFISSMPIKDLVESIKDKEIPEDVKNVALNLMYRDFITIGLLLKKININNNNTNTVPKDNWLYIQENSVKLGRIQIFNNWSEQMVKDKNNIWVGLEYFVSSKDDLWKKEDNKIAAFAINELISLNIINKSDILDYKVVKMPKAYPAYFGSYKNFNIIKKYLNSVDNLYLIGRNGTHKYNNMDHSMLTAIKAVEVIKYKTSKDAIWEVNTEKNYHESK